MKEGFVAEILRAAGTLRSGDPAGATEIIRASLAAGGLPMPDNAALAAARRSAEPTRQRSFGGNADGGPRGDQAHVHAEPLSKATAEQPSGSRRHRPRTSLREAVRILSEGRKAALPGGNRAGRGMPAPVLVADGAEFRDLRYSCAAGTRRYRLYVPASAAQGPRGLVVMLHGCTQSPEDFAAGTGMNRVAEENRLLVVYPAQTNRENPMACWNWFRPGDQMREAGEPAIIAGLTESIRAEFRVPKGRVFVAGLSAGGAMAAIMGETYPDLYAAIGVHSGLAFGSANDVRSALSAMQGQEVVPGECVGGRAGPNGAAAPRLIVFHGSADSTVHPANAGRIVARHAGDLSRIVRSDHAAAGGTRGHTRLVLPDERGVPALECWMIDGAEHAWSGGHPSGSYTDPRGPDASAEMVRFFLAEGGGEA